MKKIYQFLGKAEVFISATCFTISLVLIFSSAIARALKHPINWSQDMSLFLFAWAVFLSADAALRADKLINIDLLVSHFPQNLRKYIAIATYVLILGFLVILMYNGIKLSLFSRRRVFQGIPGFSYSWVIISIPVSALLQSATVILKLKQLLRRG
ncbi:MAG TPA: C4-dicarboxylate ABC transporter [Spirochaetaceae bacterium]|nr:C4-dicarboxylate ABC transporter [Spirochaetaceae bacterium]